MTYDSGGMTDEQLAAIMRKMHPEASLEDQILTELDDLATNAYIYSLVERNMAVVVQGAVERMRAILCRAK